MPHTWNLLKKKKRKLTSGPGPARDNKTGKNTKPFIVPITISAARRWKKYLSEEMKWYFWQSSSFYANLERVRLGSLRIFTKIGRDRVKDCGIESLATKFAPNLKNNRRDERVHMFRRLQHLTFRCSQLYLTIKSKSDPASIMTPSSVETAPSTTGENTCSTARCIRWFLSPLLVKNCCKQSKA